MLAALGMLLAMTLVACAGERAEHAPPAAMSSHQVQAIAENMLAAYNLGDYQAFSRDLSLPAKLIVDENVFAEFRSENLSVTGPFMAVTGVQPEPAKPGRRSTARCGAPGGGRVAGPLITGPAASRAGPSPAGRS